MSVSDQRTEPALSLLMSPLLHTLRTVSSEDPTIVKPGERKHNSHLDLQACLHCNTASKEDPRGSWRPGCAGAESKVGRALPSQGAVGCPAERAHLGACWKGVLANFLPVLLHASEQPSGPGVHQCPRLDAKQCSLLRWGISKDCGAASPCTSRDPVGTGHLTMHFGLRTSSL